MNMKARRDVLRGAAYCMLGGCPGELCPYHRTHRSMSCIHALLDDIDRLLYTVRGVVDAFEKQGEEAQP